MVFTFFSPGVPFCVLTWEPSHWNFEYYASKRKSKDIVMCIVLILISSRKLLKFLNTENIHVLKYSQQNFHMYSPDFTTEYKCKFSLGFMAGR